MYNKIVKKNHKMDKYRKDIKKKNQDKRKDIKLQQQQKEYLDKDPQVLLKEFLKLELMREQERLNDSNLKAKRKTLKQVLISNFKIDIVCLLYFLADYNFDVLQIEKRVEKIQIRTSGST